jgi:predicted metal-binding membrane protein
MFPIRLGEDEKWRLDLLLMLGGVMTLLWVAIVVLLYLILLSHWAGRTRSGNAGSDVRCECGRTLKVKLK